MKRYNLILTDGFSQQLVKLPTEIKVWVVGHMEYVLEKIEAKETIIPYFIQASEELKQRESDVLPLDSALRISEVEDSNGDVAAYLYAFYHRATETIFVTDITIIYGAPSFVEVDKLISTLQTGKLLAHSRTSSSRFVFEYSSGFGRDMDKLQTLDQDAILAYLKRLQNQAFCDQGWENIQLDNELKDAVKCFTVEAHHYYVCYFTLPATEMPVQLICSLQSGMLLLLSCILRSPTSHQGNVETLIKTLHRRAHYFSTEKNHTTSQKIKLKIFYRLRDSESSMFMDDLDALPQKWKEEVERKLRFGTLVDNQISIHNIEELVLEKYLINGVKIHQRRPPTALHVWVLPRKKEHGGRYFCGLGYLRGSTITLYRCLLLNVDELPSISFVQDALRLFEIDETLGSTY